MGLEDVSLHAACHQLNFTYFAMRMKGWAPACILPAAQFHRLCGEPGRCERACGSRVSLSPRVERTFYSGFVAYDHVNFIDSAMDLGNLSFHVACQQRSFIDLTMILEDFSLHVACQQLNFIDLATSLADEVAYRSPAAKQQLFCDRLRVANDQLNSIDFATSHEDVSLRVACQDSVSSIRPRRAATSTHAKDVLERIP